MRVAGTIAAVFVLLVAAFWLLGDRSGTALPAFAYRHQHTERVWYHNWHGAFVQERHL